MSAVIIKIAFETPQDGLLDADNWNVLDYRTFLYRGKSYTNYLDAYLDVPRSRWTEACFIIYVDNIFANKIHVSDRQALFTLVEECRRERDKQRTEYLKETHSYFNE